MEKQRKMKIIRKLEEAQQELRSINFANTNDPLDISRPSDLVSQWLDKWEPTFKMLKALSPDSEQIEKAILTQMHGYEQETDAEIFDELRDDFVKLIDAELSKLEKGNKLEEYIKRVNDEKLKVLLKEFDAVKDIAPNHAAIGFRTILCLVIQERAKRVKPNSVTATRTDLSLIPIAQSAYKEDILPQKEEHNVRTFISMHKDYYDFTVHMPGRVNMVDKSEVDAMVDLLNKLLPLIID